MATNATGPKEWPPTQRRRLRRTIALADTAIDYLDAARKKLDARDHPALVALDIADAVRQLDDIINEMKDAENGATCQ